jgi:hypothetical protein
VDICEQRATLQRIVDDLSLGEHPTRVRAGATPAPGTASGDRRRPSDHGLDTARRCIAPI